MGCSSCTCLTETRQSINVPIQLSVKLREINTLQNESYYDQYSFIKVIGEGAQGKTFLLKNRKDEEYVVKRVNNTEKFDLIVKESTIMEKCYHPNIIHYRESFKLKNKDNDEIISVDLIMEYANDGDLGGKLEEQIQGKFFFEEKILLIWLMQICLGLSYIHKRKIIHRDIKPENILLLKNGLVKIADFGLSKRYNSEKDLQKKGTLAGTKIYMDPEVIQTRIYSDKTDIYSLGKTFYRFIESKDNYSEEFKNLINDIKDKEENRPTADEILEKPIVKNQMKSFLDKNNYKNTNAYTIMNNIKKDEELYNSPEELFILHAKKEWDELFKQNGDKNINNNERRANRDLDILMCIISRRIMKVNNN